MRSRPMHVVPAAVLVKVAACSDRWGRQRAALPDRGGRKQLAWQRHPSVPGHRDRRVVVPQRFRREPNRHVRRQLARRSNGNTARTTARPPRRPATSRTRICRTAPTPAPPAARTSMAWGRSWAHDRRWPRVGRDDLRRVPEYGVARRRWRRERRRVCVDLVGEGRVRNRQFWFGGFPSAVILEQRVQRRRGRLHAVLPVGPDESEHDTRPRVSVDVAAGEVAADRVSWHGCGERFHSGCPGTVVGFARASAPSEARRAALPKLLRGTVGGGPGAAPVRPLSALRAVVDIGAPC